MSVTPVSVEPPVLETGTVHAARSPVVIVDDTGEFAAGIASCPGGGGGGGGGFRRGIDDQALMQIADLTDGKYYPAESSSQLEQVFASLPTNLILKHEVVELSVVFVGLGGLLAGISLLLGRAWRPLP